MTLFELKLKSFDLSFIKVNAQFILFILNFLGIKQYSQVFVPNKIRKITVLRSPHIDKKSREQFQIKKYKQLISIPVNDPQLAILFLEILKNSQLHGIELEINIKFMEYFA